MVFIQETIYLKWRMGINNKSSWVSINRNSLYSIWCECWNGTYFDSFGAEHVPKQIKKFIGNKNISIYRIQAFNLIMCGYFCIGFIDFMF